MKRMSWLVLGCVVLAAGAAMADPDHPAPKASRDLERIKHMAGRWEGTATHAEGAVPEPASVEYQVTSGGSAVVETLFPGTPHEMVSMYHDVNGTLAMTHYCMLGNQPQLGLTKSDAGHLALSLIPSPGIDPGTDQHMHSLDIVWRDADHVTQTWTGYEHGAPKDSTTIQLARVKG